MKNMRFITDYLVYNSKQYPEKTAVIYKNKSISWKELEKKVANFSEFLKKYLKRKQKVVAILLPNSLDFIVSHLAILYLKHISCPLDISYKKLELIAIINQLKPNLIITSKKKKTLLKKINVKIIFVEDIKYQNKEAKLNKLKGDPKKVAATLLFTSGTTGKPKATLYSHANHLWNIKVLSKLWKWTEKDTLLLSLPLSHWHGLVIGLTGAIYKGNTIFLEEKFNTQKTLQTLSSGNISLFMHVPPAYLHLVNYPNSNKYDLKKVRLFISGSSYLPPSIWKKFYLKWGQKILERYGSSEAGIICSNLYNDRRPGSVGKPLPGVRIKFLKNHEIAVKSPGVFMGYYKNKKATQEKFTDEGFFKTGDVGIMKKDKWVYLKGRVQERIKRKGYTLYPRDIEWAINKHPDIIDSYVVGLQTKSLNDKLIYFIVCKKKVSKRKLIEYFKRNMPKIWLPDRTIFLNIIPKTKSGKPKIKELKKFINKKFINN